MLTPEQTTALQAWIDAAVPVLRLSHWHVLAESGDPDDADCFAQSFIRDNSDAARIRLGAAFWEDDAEGRRRTLVHELLHCHLYRSRAHTGDLADRLGSEAATLAREMRDRLEELAIEQLVWIIAPLLPLPEIPDPPKEVT